MMRTHRTVQKILYSDVFRCTKCGRRANRVHTALNPTQVVPAGPDPSGWLAPHHRQELGGRPFGDGTPPGPPPEAERVPPAHGAG